MTQQCAIAGRRRPERGRRSDRSCCRRWPPYQPPGSRLHHLRPILAEADLLMAIDGYPTFADLRKGALRRVG
jgi:hypothetical protein